MAAAVGLYYAALLVLGVSQRVRYSVRQKKDIEALRSLSDASRSEVLSGLRGEPVGVLIEREVLWHGRPEITGVVERFKFSPVDQRQARLMMLALWSGAAVGGLAFAVAFAGAGIPSGVKIAAVALTISLGVSGARASKRRRELVRSFEVSPFGLSEVRPGVGIRRVLWDMPLVLRNNQRAKRLELSVYGAPGFIDIPYGVIQLERLIQLIVEKGDLRCQERLSGELAQK
jgi:hypothetical protein